jgi:hypothetical protein
MRKVRGAKREPPFGIVIDDIIKEQVMHVSSSFLYKHREGRGIATSAWICDGELEILSHSPPRLGMKYEMPVRWFKIDIDTGIADPLKTPPCTQSRGAIDQWISIEIVRHSPQMQGIADSDGGVGLRPENRSVVRRRNHRHGHIIGSTTASEEERGQEKNHIFL